MRASGLQTTLLQRLLACGALATLVACADGGGSDPYRMPAKTPEQVRAQITTLIPASVSDRAAWANDIHAALVALRQPTTADQVCAVLAVIEQESTYRADPPVANLAAISREEILRRADRAGVPEFAVRVALQLKSPNGKTYDERLSAVRTERDLSLMYEDFIGEVPLGKTLFEGWNPVQTAGAMQVSIAFAEQHAKQRPYPHEIKTSLRHEVFTRRGGLYFGIAHLLDYPAQYQGSDGREAMIYRFADFNAGRYASRNAAFQQALSNASGRKLDLDGDLISRSAKADSPPGQTEAAALSLAAALGMSAADIRRDLLLDDQLAFSQSTLATRLYALADRKAGAPVSRATLPRIQLQSPKITRKLTTEWFATRVQARHEACLKRAT